MVAAAGTVMPEATAVAMPPVLTTATAVLLLTHDPPDVMSLSDTALPWHMDSVPVIGAGSGFTVMLRVFMHPTPAAVNVRLAVPVFTPVTTPLVVLKAATNVLPLVHVPVAVGDKATALFSQTAGGPEVTGRGRIDLAIIEVHPSGAT
jgi:hypothetical protein